MTSQTRPRLEEFLLALLWIIGTGGWGYFGVVGYKENLTNPNISFNLTGFILSFFLICLTVFGLRFVLNTFRRLWTNSPGWVDTVASLTLGITLILGCFFSLFTLVVALLQLFEPKVDNLVFGWGVAACLAIIGLAVYQFFAALNVFEPFWGWDNGEENSKTPGPLRYLINLQRRFHGRNFGPRRAEEHIRGPLIMENDTRTSLIEEKSSGRAGLEKTLVAHGGYHVNMMGFTANGSTVFAVSNGGMVHFQAGGRKGVMFPPELKFWELSTGKVQVAILGAPQTFLTNHYHTPPSLQNYRFLVPSGGGKFAWISPNMIQVGNWSNEQIQSLEVAEGLVLRSANGFVPIAFNPEGSRLAWCAPDGQTRFWNLDSDQVQPLRSYPGGGPEAQTGTENGAWGLVFSPDGTRIATLGGRGILLQNVYTGWRWFRPLEANREKLTAFAFNNNGFEMAVGLHARPDAIRLNAKRGRNGHSLSSTTGNSAAAEMLAGAGFDITSSEFVPVVRLWDLREDRHVDLLIGKAPLRELAYSPDNRLLAGVDEEGILRVWEIAVEGSANRPPRLTLQLDLGLTGRKVVIGFSPDIAYLLCATDNRILLWNLSKLHQETRV